MASSNRHWPSMFKSKPCNNHNNSHQWQLHDHNPNSLLSTGCHRPPYTSGPGCEERSPEPKPRWNPKPEQIRILEAIFNSGIVNPPRDEIRKIRAQLQEYGQVGDANVFYWFQNRKSRSKHKLRKQPAAATSSAPRPPPPSATSSSSSSSDKSSPKGFPIMEMTNSPKASASNNPTFFQAPEFLAEPYAYPMEGFSFPTEVSGGVHVPPVDANMLLGELLMMNKTNTNANNYSHIGSTKKVDHDDHEKVYNTSVDATSVSNDTSASLTNTTTVPSTISHFLGIGLGDSNALGLAKSTVFINDVAFEVNVGPFNVREAFGEDAMLIQSNGQPVFTNEWGVTFQSLQHGGFYYLMRTLAPVTVSEAQLI